MIRLIPRANCFASALAGSLGYRSLPEVLEVAPAAARVAVGRAALTRAVLVGLDRALRDLLDTLGT